MDILENEGMPLFQAEGFGKLYATYHVIFPAVVDDQFVKDIRLAFENRAKRQKKGEMKKDEL